MTMAEETRARPPKRAEAALQTETDPGLLVLPSRRHAHKASRQEDAQACLEKLQFIETGCGPEVETAALRDLLTHSAGLFDSLADPIEVHNYHNPLASVHAYQHRLHALRCEYVQARLRTLDLEEQCVQARSLIERLESRVKLLEAPLEQMKSSLAWKVAVKGFRFWWMISRWLRLLRGSAA